MKLKPYLKIKKIFIILIKSISEILEMFVRKKMNKLVKHFWSNKVVVFTGYQFYRSFFFVWMQSYKKMIAVYSAKL